MNTISKFLVLSLFSCAASFSFAQNIGIGTTSPQTKLSVNGGFSATPVTAAAAAAVTIPDNVSVFRLSNVAGTQVNALSVTNGKEGQFLTIYNQDNDAATFAGTTISATNGVATFVYINGGWRNLANAPGFNGGTLDFAYDYGGAGAGRIINADAGAVLVQGIDGIQSTGTFGSGLTLALSGAGTRMMWYPKKAAFRAGFVDGTQWNDANIGDYSVAMGEKPTASGVSSFASGRGTVASGVVSTALGAFTNATNVGAVSIGLFNTASGNASMAFGVNATSSGNTAIAIGNRTTATGSTSIAMGDSTTASGTSAIAMGNNVTSVSFAETVIGRYNTTYTPGSATSWNTGDRIFSIGNGTATTARSNAFVMLKNGNLGIGTTAPTAPTMGLHQINVNGILAEGTFGSGNTVSSTGAGTRMVWYPRKAAFRAGRVTALQWDDSNIGNYSVSFGLNNTAMGAHTTAIGNETQAVGTNSFAAGYQTIATGSYATALGRNTTADGNTSLATGYLTSTDGFFSFAAGRGATATGDTAIALGYNTIASGNTSLATGYFSTASGVNSTAMGDSTLASGRNSSALGNQTEAAGINSLAIGHFTDALARNTVAMGDSSVASGRNAGVWGTKSEALADYNLAFGRGVVINTYAEIAMGAYNNPNPAGSSSTWIGTERLFSIGNGTNTSNRSNAVVVLKNGNTGIGTSSPAFNLDVRGATTNSDGIIQVSNSDASHFVRIFGGRQADPHPFLMWKDADDFRFATDNSGFYEVARFQKVGTEYFMGINNMNPTERLEVNGNLRVNGNICYTGSIGACSDLRFKTNLMALSSSILNNVMKVTPYYYDWKIAEFPDRAFENRRQIGFIAQEMERIFPEIVNTDKQGYKSIDYAKATPILWEAVKELNQNNTKLEDEVNQLKAEMESLKKAVYGNVSR